MVMQLTPRARAKAEEEHQAWWAKNRKKLAQLDTVVVCEWILQPNNNIVYRDWIGLEVQILSLERRWDTIPVLVKAPEMIPYYDLSDPDTVLSHMDTLWVERVAEPIHVPTFTNATDAYLWLNGLDT